jgi:hypothetical protein
VVLSLSRRRARFAGLVTGIALVFPPALGHADDIDACVTASERGQEARRQRTLGVARGAFIRCSADKCPAPIRSACTGWLDEVDQVQPSVVVAVAQQDGADIPHATITIDGRPAVQGTAVPLDPGLHTVDVHAAGHASASSPFTAREGEKNRVLRVTLTKSKPSPPPLESASISASASPSVRPITWLTLGLSALALGGFVYLGLNGQSRADELRGSCGPSCPSSDRDEVKTRFLLADVSLLAAVVLGGVSVYTFLEGRTSTSSPKVASTR